MGHQKRRCPQSHCPKFFFGSNSLLNFLPDYIFILRYQRRKILIFVWKKLRTNEFFYLKYFIYKVSHTVFSNFALEKQLSNSLISHHYSKTNRFPSKEFQGVNSIASKYLRSKISISGKMSYFKKSMGSTR